MKSHSVRKDSSYQSQELIWCVQKLHFDTKAEFVTVEVDP